MNSVVEMVIFNKGLVCRKPVQKKSSHGLCFMHAGNKDAAKLGAALNALEQEHAILEAAVTSAITHPNVVSRDSCK